MEIRLGYTQGPDKLIDLFKKREKHRHIHPHTSIYWNIKDYSIFIFSDGGECIRHYLRQKSF